MTDTMQIAIGAAVMGVSFWYFFFGPGHTSSGDQARPPGSRRQVPQADINRVVETFPTISPAAARYDLEKTGNVQITLNNYLERGFLQEPPAGYYEPIAPPPPAPAARPAAPTAARQAAAALKAPTLIQKLGLQDRVLEDVTNVPSLDKGKGKSWAGSAEDRESTLRLRKEQMVLQARKALIEKDRKGKAPAI